MIGPGQLVAYKISLSTFSGKAPLGYAIEGIYVLVADAASKVAYLEFGAARNVATFSLNRMSIVRVLDAPDFD